MTRPRDLPRRPPDPHPDAERNAPLPRPFDEVVCLFNAGEFRACVEPLERLFFADRTTFYQGLLHLVVALLQTKLGMVRGPRIRLASAAELLALYTPRHRGVDVAAILTFIERCLERLPEGVVQMPVAEIERLGLPGHELRETADSSRPGNNPGIEG